MRIRQNHPDTPVSAVIVTYHCDSAIAETVEALLKQVKDVTIVDNASAAESAALLRSLAGRFPGRVHLHMNAENMGLAAAQNIGIRRALAAGAPWVLLMDDDSLPEEKMVERLLGAADDRAGILAPDIVERNVSQRTRYVMETSFLTFSRRPVEKGEVLKDVAMAIASGSLIRAEALKAAGLMTEGYFIDSVDFEFCLRVRRRGYRILVVGDARLLHRQGDKRLHALWGMGAVTPHYGPARRYYIFRNRLFMLRRHGKNFPFLWSYVGMACVWDLLRVLLFEADKTAKLGAAFRGLRHGLTSGLPEPADWN